MCRIAANQTKPTPIQGAAPEIVERYKSNLDGLLNMEASKESAVTENGKPPYTLGFHWMNWTDLAVVLVALLFVALVARKFWVRKQKKKTA